MAEFSHILALRTSLAFASVTCDVVSDLITLQETQGITVIHYWFQAPLQVHLTWDLTGQRF